MDEPVRHGPRSLFVLGTVTGVADHNHSRAPTTDHPPTSTTTRLHREPPRPSPPGACSPSAPHIKSAAISHGEHGFHRPAAGPALVNTNICRLIQTSLASPFPPSPALLLQLSWALCCFCSWPLSVLSFSCCNGYLRLQSHSFKLLSLLSPCSSHPFSPIVHHLDNPLDSHHHTL